MNNNIIDRSAPPKVDESCFILSGFLPMTSEEKEAFSFDDIMKTTEILGRTYAITNLEQHSNGTFTAKLRPVVKLIFPEHKE